MEFTLRRPKASQGELFLKRWSLVVCLTNIVYICYNTNSKSSYDIRLVHPLDKSRG